MHGHSNSAYVDHPKCSVFRFKDASVSAVSDIHLATDDSHMLVVGAQGFSLYEYAHSIQKQLGNMALKLVHHSIVYCNECVQVFVCSSTLCMFTCGYLCYSGTSL